MKLKNAFYRVNAKGDRELIVKSPNKKRDKETLSELKAMLGAALIALCDSIEYAGREDAAIDTPELVSKHGDRVAAAGESPNNMRGSTKRAANSPETSRSKVPTNAIEYDKKRQR